LKPAAGKSRRAWKRGCAVCSAGKLMRRVIWSPLAEQQAVRIVQRLWRSQRGVAWRWTQGILRQTGALSRNALDGFSVPELSKRVRIGEIHVDPVRVIYRVSDKTVEILTIRSPRKPLHNRERNRHHHRK
jgi:plasmid stabilization system protein ParE